MLVGRESERATLANLLSNARAGRGSALVLTGAPGIGKTALLEDLKQRARGMLILQARGVEAESELPYAGLSELVAPVLHLAETLPRRRRAALEAALGLADVPAVDRFGSYAATLGLLAEAAERSPVLALVDDAHWLDAASAEALRFASRRLVHDSVCVIFALREQEGASFQASGLDELRIDGLSRAAAGKLLEAQAAGSVADEVIDALIAATGGNPLALHELARMLSSEQLSGTRPLPDPLPAGPDVERAFGTRIAALCETTRRALVIAAADDSGQLETLARALRLRALDLDALSDAETAGLISMDGGRVEFAHPLLRAASYSRPTAAERRDAHAALAEVLTDSRRAWHLAAAALEPSEPVARELDAAAAEAHQRAAPATAGRAWETAARLSPETQARVRRLTAAGHAYHLAGDPQDAVRVLDAALALADDPLPHADAALLRARVQGMRRSAKETRALMIDEAARISPHDPTRAATMLLEAAAVSVPIGDLREALRLAEEGWRVAAGGDESLRLFGACVLAAVRILRGDTAGGVPLLDQARPLVESHDLSVLGSMGVLVGHVRMWVGDYRESHDMLASVVTRLRREGALSLLPYALGGLAFSSYFLGNWRAAESLARESLQLAEEVDQQPLMCEPSVCLALLAGAQGRNDEARAHVRRVMRLIERYGVDSMRTMAAWASGQHDIAVGAYEDAVRTLESAARFALENGLEEPGVGLWAVELPEAYARLGRAGDALAAVELLESQAKRTGRTLALAGAGRCRGVLAGDDDFEPHFQRALDWHEATPVPFERARTLLCLGERRRRRGHRVDAREPLRDALAVFDALGAEPWTERARRELAASGERARRREPATADQLTPQELQVARLVADGATNKEAAAALFVSPKTIDTHLQRAYRKLGLRSRVELARYVQDVL